MDIVVRYDWTTVIAVVDTPRGMVRTEWSCMDNRTGEIVPFYQSSGREVGDAFTSTDALHAPVNLKELNPEVTEVVIYLQRIPHSEEVEYTFDIVLDDLVMMQWGQGEYTIPGSQEATWKGGTVQDILALNVAPLELVAFLGLPEEPTLEDITSNYAWSVSADDPALIDQFNEEFLGEK